MKGNIVSILYILKYKNTNIFILYYSIEVDRLNTLSDNEEAEVPYDSTHESEPEAEMDDENHYYDDYRQFLHVIQPFIAKLNNATTVAGESMLPGIQEI